MPSSSSSSPATSTTEDSASSSRKRVRINSQPNAVVTIEPRNEQERSDSWWSPSDFSQTKDQVKQKCRDHRRKRRFSDVLTDAYRKSQEIETQNDAMLPHKAWVDITTGASSDCQEEDEGDDADIRGLEGYSSRLHALRRQRHLQENKHAVFLEQARQTMTETRDEERLAAYASAASQRARNFAALLGEVDAWIAIRDDKKLRSVKSTHSNSNCCRDPDGVTKSQANSKKCESSP